MELKKRLEFRKVLVGAYFVLLAMYLVVGLQPAEATNYEIATELSIPSIGLDSDVTILQVEERELKTPETIVGSYGRARNKTLLIGHSTTVFQDLEEVKLGDVIMYDDAPYKVFAIELVEKAEINMNEILAPADEETLVLMTCAGTLLDGGDATHRLIVTAVAE